MASENQSLVDLAGNGDYNRHVFYIGKRTEPNRRRVFVDLTDLKQQFVAMYPESGTPFVCRVPGRVNLMGEHLDYNGLPVLPMAIDRAIYMAFAPNSGSEIRIANRDARFSPVTFENVTPLEPSTGGAWENYAKAAIAGLNAHFSPEKHPGMDVLITSDLPPAAGLSSSSALVVGFGMAYLAAMGLTLGRDITRLELAGLLANAEHYVGTAGGGMDQTAILHGTAGCATRINFLPFQVEQVPLPKGVEILVCDSLVEARKSGGALDFYNAGPAACSLITALVNTHLQQDFGEDFAIECLGELWYGDLCFNRKEVEALFASILPAAHTTPSELATRLNMPLAQLKEYWLDEIPFGEAGLPLQARARHVMTEFYRVEEGRDALLAGDGATFGAHMNASHQSCANDYEISTPELDGLCKILNDAGSYGARLTGAGFGGAVVAMVPVASKDAVFAAVQTEYYGGRTQADGASPAFYVTASAGALHL